MEQPYRVKKRKTFRERLTPSFETKKTAKKFAVSILKGIGFAAGVAITTYALFKILNRNGVIIPNHTAEEILAATGSDGKLDTSKLSTPTQRFLEKNVSTLIESADKKVKTKYPILNDEASMKEKANEFVEELTGTATQSAIKQLHANKGIIREISSEALSGATSGGVSGLWNSITGNKTKKPRISADKRAAMEAHSLGLTGLSPTRSQSKIDEDYYTSPENFGKMNFGKINLKLRKVGKYIIIGCASIALVYFCIKYNIFFSLEQIKYISERLGHHKQLLKSTLFNLLYKMRLPGDSNGTMRTKIILLLYKYNFINPPLALKPMFDFLLSQRNNNFGNKLICQRHPKRCKAALAALIGANYLAPIVYKRYRKRNFNINTRSGPIITTQRIEGFKLN